MVTYSQLRPLEPSVSSAPGLAHLCSLAYVKVPSLEEDYGQEAAVGLSEHTLDGPKEFRASPRRGIVQVEKLKDKELGQSL